MYTPPFAAILNCLRAAANDEDKTGRVEIPGTLLRLLLQFAVSASDFDEQRYLTANPDVRAAVEKGDVGSGFLHYLRYGYFEGRRGGIDLDSEWYATTYPDVAKAVSSGKLTSVADHFYSIGGGEGRSPSADQAEAAAQWKAALAMPKKPAKQRAAA